MNDCKHEELFDDIFTRLSKLETNSLLESSEVITKRQIEECVKYIFSKTYSAVDAFRIYRILTNGDIDDSANELRRILKYSKGFLGLPEKTDLKT